ncbi:hypothetical protein [Sphingomonas koreensis]
MNRRDLVGAGMLAPLLALPARAAEAGGLDWLLGEWAGEGRFFGRPSKARLGASQLLAGRFLELRWSVSAGTTRYEGRGLYRLGAQAIEGHWYDVTGAIRPLVATLEETSLRSDWRGDERGHSVYRRDGTALIVEDRVAGSAGDRLFSSHRLIQLS